MDNKNSFKKLTSTLCLLALMFAGTASAKYKSGEIYDENGLKGIIVYVDDSGEHGLIMSLERCGKKWLKDSDEKFGTAAFYEDDGQKNMDALQGYINENNLSWELFPLFEWARSLGEGWYIPATDELAYILQTINGGEGKFNKKYMKNVSKSIKKADGDKLMDSGFGAAHDNHPYIMYSSTEADGGTVYMLYFQESMGSMAKKAISSMGGLGTLTGKTPKGEFKIQAMPKNIGGKSMYGSRAVHKF